MPYEIILLIGLYVLIYSLMSIGLNIQWGDAGIMNFGLAGFFGIGAYTSILLTTPVNSGAIFSRVVGFNFPVIVGLLGGSVVAGAVGGIVALSSARVSGDYLAIVFLAFGQITHTFVMSEDWLTGGVQGISNIPPILETQSASGYDVMYFGFSLAVVAIAYFLTTRLSASSFGRVLRAIRESNQAAMALGKNPIVYKLKVVMIGSALVGLGGALLAHYLGSFSPRGFQLSLTFLIWTALIIGGMGSYRGTVAGTVVIMSIYQLSRYIPQDIPLGDEMPHVRMILIGIILITILYYRPEGLFGNKDQLSAGDISL